MSTYKHLSIDEREIIMVLSAQGKSFADIARTLGRHRSTIMRELSRNKQDHDTYHAHLATIAYRRKKSAMQTKI